MSDPFDNVDLLRVILEAETDADSPGSEELMSQIRENWEVLTILFGYTGDKGSATENPSETVLTDDGAAYDVDEHNGRSLVIIDGLAAGNIYTIDDTAATTLTCTGDTLLADGVRSGDEYKIFFNLKNTSAHTHDDVDSAIVVLADNQVTQVKMADDAIGQAELNIARQSQSNDIAQETDHKFTLTGGEYCFRPTAKGETTDVQWGASVGETGLTAAFATVVMMYNNNGGAARFGYVDHSYVQASGEVYWIFILRDKITKINIGISACSDHPCFGQGGKPNLMPHPFLYNFDDAIHELIVINPTDEQVLEMQKKCSVESEDLPDRCLAEVIMDEYVVDDTIEPDWPDIPVTVGLPPEWEEKPIGAKIEPIKKIIPKPNYIKTAELKLKK